ncbi:CinA family nicotinamide mononucleotide deamidase-related protein [Chryseobacterium taklimakanense]|uniref:CinA family nicotinamide mononucleotide deamidase-related protein n=1 Tax=Chryseobacterium taklimakanense TaxID=536441 RepID=UPI0023F6E1AA|nr:CinA family nicotinamide mononucleotide deamidase-related protein [Chryseobacterium taklimakanense]
MATAALITIGDEILSGITVDTNSSFIASELKKIGIPVKQIFTVSDDIGSIKTAMKRAFDIAEIVFTTGGIGPTKDDKTKTAYAEFFHDKLTLDEETFHHLKQLLIKRKRENLLEINKGQAEVLSKAKVFQNDNGTAPCMVIEENSKTAICLPGVPFEVKPLVGEKIIPFLTEKYQLSHIVTRIISVVNFPESLLSETISDWELALPEQISLSYLPIGTRIKLRLTAVGNDKEALENELNDQIFKLKPYIEGHVIAWDGNEIQVILKEILSGRNLTISTAESCTGGEIAKLITGVSGCSTTFLGGVIPYDFHKKIEFLGVSPQTIEEKTVVSAEVAQEMSLGCQKLFKTDISVSTTGVAGPNTDEFNTQVGEVFYSIRVKDFEQTNRLFLPHLDRRDFMFFVAQRVLQDLVEILVKENG